MNRPHPAFRQQRGQLPPWPASLALAHPLYQILQPWLAQLQQACPHWPSPAELQLHLGSGLFTAQGHALRFVDQVAEASALPYEQRIAQAGEVNTRLENWHDLFNALIWRAWPQTKAALNACHVQYWQAGPRGPMRDALTLLDENGLILVTDDVNDVQRWQAHDWLGLFWQQRARWGQGLAVFCVGHASLEKGLAPYVGWTAPALACVVAPEFWDLSPQAQLAHVDARVAAHLQASPDFSPKQMGPLPVLGIPGYWPENDQAAFYANHAYFRPASPARTQPFLRLP